MNALSAGMDAVQVLGWALLHFCWQAILIGASYALLRRGVPRGEARYVLGMTALLVLALCPVLTAWRVAGAVSATGGEGVGQVAAVFGRPLPQPAPGDEWSWQFLLSAALPWLVLAWFCGVAFLSMRVWRHWGRLRVLVSAAQAVPVWQERLGDLARRFGLRRGVRVLSSPRVATPTLVGWIRPVILLPLAVSSGFPVAQVELILAHELAHLRRLDHLANLFQVVLETLLFYHPVVHWISRDVRNERELCCDALALRVTGGSRREFAAALVELEEFRETHAGLTLAANGGVLLERIGQITRPDRGATIARQPGWFGGTLSALLVAALLLSLVWRQFELQRNLSDPATEVEHLLISQLLPASIRMPMQTIADLVPRHIAASPTGIVPAHSAVIAGEGMNTAPVPKQQERLALAMPALRIADLSPSRLKLTSLEMPRETASEPKAPEALTPTHIEQPVYPISALQQGIEGKVVIEFSLDADGSVREPEVVDAQPGSVFNHAASHALLGWRFSPPAPGSASRRYRQTFTFTLHPGSDTAGREVHAKAACYVVTGSNICRVRGLDAAFAGGVLH